MEDLPHDDGTDHGSRAWDFKEDVPGHRALQVGGEGDRALT